MAKLSNVGVFLVMVAMVGTSLTQLVKAATTIEVGGTGGWKIPTDSEGADFYSFWASNHAFKVGDILVFPFVAGKHDVAKVKKQASDNCNIIGHSPIFKGLANFTLNSTGHYYFIYTFPGHCDAGQKLAIKVSFNNGSSGSEPGAAPTLEANGPFSQPNSATGGIALPPQGSAASNLAATFSIVSMSIAIGLLCLF